MVPFPIHPIPSYSSVVFTTEKNLHKIGLVQLLDCVVLESAVIAKQSTTSGNLAVSNHLF